jgi:hypothetical protein
MVACYIVMWDWFGFTFCKYSSLSIVACIFVACIVACKHVMGLVWFNLNCMPESIISQSYITLMFYAEPRPLKKQAAWKTTSWKPAVSRLVQSTVVPSKPVECHECHEGMDLYCVLLNYFPVGEIGVAEKHSFMLLTIPLFATGCGNNICVTKSPVAVVTVCVEINSISFVEFCFRSHLSQRKRQNIATLDSSSLDASRMQRRYRIIFFLTYFPSNRISWISFHVHH